MPQEVYPRTPRSSSSTGTVRRPGHTRILHQAAYTGSSIFTKDEVAALRRSLRGGRR